MSGSIGQPGLTFDVTMQTTVEVARTQNDIVLGPEIQIATGDGGGPRCTVNPAIEKDGTSFLLTCEESGVCRLRALVRALDNVNPIPPGSTLYTCEIVITDQAVPAQDYPLTCMNPDASDPRGKQLSVACVDGAVFVSDIVFATPTPTETPAAPSATPTATITPVPSATSTEGLPSPTATGTAPFIVTHTGCQVAPGDSDLAWLLGVPPFLLARRRKRPHGRRATRRSP